jgi:hypothetical protein
MAVFGRAHAQHPWGAADLTLRSALLLRIDLTLRANDAGGKRTVLLPGTTFIGRFLLHILPTGKAEPGKRVADFSRSAAPPGTQEKLDGTSCTPLNLDHIARPCDVLPTVRLRTAVRNASE